MKNKYYVIFIILITTFLSLSKMYEVNAETYNIGDTRSMSIQLQNEWVENDYYNKERRWTEEVYDFNTISMAYDYTWEEKEWVDTYKSVKEYYDECPSDWTKIGQDLEHVYLGYASSTLEKSFTSGDYYYKYRGAGIVDFEGNVYDTHYKYEIYDYCEKYEQSGYYKTVRYSETRYKTVDDYSNPKWREVTGTSKILYTTIEHDALPVVETARSSGISLYDGSSIIGPLEITIHPADHGALMDVIIYKKAEQYIKQPSIPSVTKIPSTTYEEYQAISNANTTINIQLIEPGEYKVVAIGKGMYNFNGPSDDVVEKYYLPIVSTDVNLPKEFISGEKVEGYDNVFYGDTNTVLWLDCDDYYCDYNSLNNENYSYEYKNLIQDEDNDNIYLLLDDNGRHEFNINRYNVHNETTPEIETIIVDVIPKFIPPTVYLNGEAVHYEGNNYIGNNTVNISWVDEKNDTYLVDYNIYTSYTFNFTHNGNDIGTIEKGETFTEPGYYEIIVYGVNDVGQSKTWTISFMIDGDANGISEYKESRHIGVNNDIYGVLENSDKHDFYYFNLYHLTNLNINLTDVTGNLHYKYRIRDEYSNILYEIDDEGKNIIFKKDANGNDILDEEGNKIPLIDINNLKPSSYVMEVFTKESEPVSNKNVYKLSLNSEIITYQDIRVADTGIDVLLHNETADEMNDHIIWDLLVTPSEDGLITVSESKFYFRKSYDSDYVPGTIYSMHGVIFSDPIIPMLEGGLFGTDINFVLSSYYTEEDFLNKNILQDGTYTLIPDEEIKFYRGSAKTNINFVDQSDPSIIFNSVTNWYSFKAITTDDYIFTYGHPYDGLDHYLEFDVYNDKLTYLMSDGSKYEDPKYSIDIPTIGTELIIVDTYCCTNYDELPMTPNAKIRDNINIIN